MMNAPDSTLPSETAQIVSRWTRRGSLSQPNSHSPRNVDSRKNAASPSIASGAPKMLPTSREYAPQFIPNWNSCTRPVTTPIATLITSSDAEEPGQPQVIIAFGSVPRRLQQRGQEAQPDRDRHEEEMIDRHERELHPRQIDVHRLPPVSFIRVTRRCADRAHDVCPRPAAPHPFRVALVAPDGPLSPPLEEAVVSGGCEHAGQDRYR